MDAQTVMQMLKAKGTAQNRKVYRRHGVGENLFGVSYADLARLVKTIKKDTPLAQSLWQTSNHDARVLAAMITNPADITIETLLAWSTDLDNYPITDEFAKLAARTPYAHQLMVNWTQVDEQYIGRAGWHILARLAVDDTILPDDFFEPYLAVIETRIHTSKNWLKAGMNNALIAIGGRTPALRELALAVASRIGKVTVDHGDTACKTPPAADYIEKIWIRKEKTAA
ncbi:MAG TPA: DNA alkylation repair protein [Anaerolineaceae bacterium]